MRIGLCQHSKEKNAIAARLINYVKAASVSETAYNEIQYQLVGLKKEYQFKIDGLENEVAELHREIQTFVITKISNN